MAKKVQITVALVAFTVIGAIFNSSAMAEATAPSSLSEMPPTVTVKIGNSVVKASDLVTKKVTILSYVKAKGLSKKVVNRANCMMIGEGTKVPSYWNSGIGASGGLYWFKDTRRTKVCKVNGQWRKVVCGNFIKFTPPKKVIEGKVIMVKSFARMKVFVHAVVRVKATGSCGWAYAAAKLNQKVWLKVFVKSKGSVVVRIYAKFFDKVKLKAKAKVHCESIVTTVPVCKSCVPPPVCTGTPEECFPKNGTTGAGEGSGGPGNGCAAGYSWNGTECVVTNPGQTGEPGTGTSGYCRDASTGEIRAETPGETTDQFGYCV